MTNRFLQGALSRFRRPNWRVLTVVVAASSLPFAGVWAWADCTRYYHSRPSDSEIEHAVLMIRSGVELGTAFLIDQDRGWFLTARHVVEPSILQSRGVSGRFAEVGAQDFELSVIADDDGYDVALLEAVDDVQFRNRKELELSFFLPEKQDVTVVGATWRGTPGNSGRTWKAELVSIGPKEFSINSEGQISVDGVRDKSGSPVIKASDGLVIGVVSEQDGERGFATPISSLTHFLSRSRVPPALSKIVENTSVPNEGTLADVFRADREKVYSNLDLVALITRMRDTWEEYRAPLLPHTIGGCETHTVAASRHLGVFAADADLLTQDFSGSPQQRRDGMSRAELTRHIDWIEKAYDAMDFDTVLKYVEHIQSRHGELPLDGLYYQGQTFLQLQRYSEAQQVLSRYDDTAYERGDYQHIAREDLLDQLWEIQQKVLADSMAFESAESDGSWASFSDYIDRFPQGLYGNKAMRLRDAAADREAFEHLKRLNKAVAYEIYIRAFPNGSHFDEAAALLEKATQAEAYEHVTSVGSAITYGSYMQVFSADQYTQDVANLFEDAADRETYRHLRSVGTAVAYELYLRSFPNGKYADEAERLRTASLDREGYEQLSGTGEGVLYDSYIRAFPSGAHAGEAQRLKGIARGAVPRFGEVTLPERRYRRGVGVELVMLPEAIGGDGPLEYRLRPEVPGLELNSVTRELRGTPETMGYYLVKYEVQDSDDDTGDGDGDSIEFAVIVEGKDCDRCPEVVVVPGGSFTMGSLESEEGRFRDESPRHEVTVAAAFGVGKYEVTLEEWIACVEDENSCDGELDHEETGAETRPVGSVSWKDAHDYVEWLSRRTGQRYRLLSESEWEYVARGGTVTSRYWGDSVGRQCEHANGADLMAKRSNPRLNVADCDDGYVRAAPVGSFRENGFGLYDVLGNLWEWTQDCWRATYNGASSDGRAVQGDNCSYVVRGGGWNSRPEALRSAARGRRYWMIRHLDVGFRVARTL